MLTNSAKYNALGTKEVDLSGFMIRRIKLILVIIFSILALLYLLFPWIAKPIIESRLDDRVQLLKLDIGYPSFSGVNIVEAKAVFEQVEFEVHSLETNLALQTIAAKSIKINLPASDPSFKQLPVIPPLPVINPKEAFLVLKNKQIAIKEILISRGSEMYSSTNIGVVYNKNDAVILTADKVNLSNFVVVEQPRIELIPGHKSLEFSILAKEHALTGNYKIEDRSIKLDISFDHKSLNRFLPEQYMTIANPSHPIEIKLVQNLDNVEGWKAQEFTELKLVSEFGLKKFGYSKALLFIELMPRQDPVNPTLHFRTWLGAHGGSSDNFQSTTQRFDTGIEFDLQINHGKVTFKDFLVKSGIRNTPFKMGEHTINIEDLIVHSEPKTFLLDDFVNRTFELELIVKDSKVRVLKFDQEKQSSSPLISTNFSLSASVKDLNKITLNSQAVLTELNLPNLSSSGETSIEFQLSDFNVDSKKGEFVVSIFDTNGSVNRFDYNSVFIDASGDLSSENVVSSGTIVINNELDIPFESSYDLHSTSAKISLTPKENLLSALNPFMSQLTKDFFSQSELEDGIIKHSGVISLGKTINAKVNMSIESGSYKFDESVVDSISSKTKLNLSSGSFSTNSTHYFEQVILSSGLEVSDVNFNLRASPQINNIENLTAKLMEGKVKSKSITTQDGKLQPSKISFEQISLFELISFLNLEALYADGNINIELPIQNKGESVIVKQGKFKNTKPGVIKYNSAEDLSESSNIALKALQNFQYKELDGTIDYDVGGNYLIKIHLLGANPDLYNGHPVDFTFNIDGNLPGLFKSLFLSGNFEQSILESLSKGKLEKLDEVTNSGKN
ncbi:MAG: YdbH domain-containing protein [Kangiellaceae bacterium]|nr:YdbH domain-containing protein [Kangiellaceae bacterium]